MSEKETIYVSAPFDDDRRVYRRAIHAMVEAHAEDVAKMTLQTTVTAAELTDDGIRITVAVSDGNQAADFSFVIDPATHKVPAVGDSPKLELRLSKVRK
jgi:hypothetical protein